MADAAGPPAPASRLSGIDIARAIALFGMLMVHFGPDVEDGLYAFPHGRASLLFAVVAGVGMALLTRRPDGRGIGRLRMAWFGVVLLPLGLWLQTLGHPVAVILQHYAVFFVFGMIICGLERRALLILALVLMVVGPALYLLGRAEMITLFNRQSIAFGDSWRVIFEGLITAGPYPLLTWSGPIAFGLFLGRLDLRDTRTRWLMVVFGIGVALLTGPVSELAQQVVGEAGSRSDWRWIFAVAPHSQMPLWLVNSTALATAVIGGALIIGDRLPRLTHPVAVLGQFVLSAYVFHLLLLAGWRNVMQHEDAGAALAVVVIYLTLFTIFALGWRRAIGRRGPVEWVLHAPWDSLAGQLARQPDPPPRAEPHSST